MGLKRNIIHYDVEMEVRFFPAPGKTILAIFAI